VELGVARSFQGSASELGAKLEQDDWVGESNFGVRTMVATAKEYRSRRANAAARDDLELMTDGVHPSRCETTTGELSLR
jgi:hypothetical protein